MDAFTVDDLITCYQRGVFPMADARHDESVFLIDPERRGVLPLDGVHIPRRLARTVRANTFEIRIDSAFDAVVEACATSRPGRLETWINAPIQRLYGELFARGLAHSVECWRDGAMVGGLYGVSLGAAFFGESMFSTERDASKVALAHLVARLRVGDYRLLDTQFITDHLLQFGALEISRADYRRRLARAWPGEADFYRLSTGATGADALQAISQAS
ncbi:leucyl/phenylalanyl-tRNA--protein transferase [Caulobacter sp.]|uniref:leucyl/phenylalanyl-tRNA--protein transferase n=1 Tax=Caulobacter sp. TaxID=78 RepID=UPI003BA8C58C